MSIGYDVSQFIKASGQSGPFEDVQSVVNGFIGLIDMAYEDYVAALQWGDRQIIAKQGADLVYLVVGLQQALGIPFDDVWDAVHESNMSKFEDGVAKFDDDGRVIKGPNYKGPEERIARLVRS